MDEKLLMDLIIDPHVVPHHVTYAFLGSAALIGVALVVRKKMELVPTGLQNVVEVFAEAMLNLAEDTIGHGWGKRLFPLIGCLFMYIMLCNFMGLIPGFASPTGNINMTASLAVPVFFATHYYGIRLHKHKYVLHFLGPMRSVAAIPLMAMMFIVEMISHVARPLTLSVRLFGNMTAKHYLLMILGMLVPAVVPTMILGLGVLVAVVQALVFSLLTTLYLAGAVEEAH